MPSVLFIFTSADTGVDGTPTGWFLPEAAHPYWVLSAESSIKIDFASPKGPNPPLDNKSVELYAEDEESVKFLNDEAVKAKLSNTKKLAEVSAKDYDAIFYIGGHGPVIDLPKDQDNIRLATDAWNLGKIVSAVCHGPAALNFIKDADGKSIFAGRNFTGFSTEEETQFGTLKLVPFYLEETITAQGGIYSKGALWGPNVVIDGKLITGQNPASAGPLGKELLKALLS